MIITIDGPTASGKSSIARLLARDLGSYYLYSGLLYRALGYLLVREYGYTHDQLANPAMEQVHELLDEKNFLYGYSAHDGAQIFFCNHDITPHLKTADVDRYASIVSAHPGVRTEILHLQRRIAKTFDIIADGRDCGTTVFPNAEYKFFLTATPEVRARRWIADQKKQGKDIAFADALAALHDRDSRDTHRECSPLVIAPGAFVIDNSDLNLQETLAVFKQKLNLPAAPFDSAQDERL